MRFFLPILLVAAACGTSEAAAGPADPAIGPPITITMSMYVVDDADGGADSVLSSQRDLAEIEEVATRMNRIWGQAGIELEIQTIARIQVPGAVINDLAAGHTSSFLFAAADGDFAVPNPAIINGFYVRQLGTANGIAPSGGRVFLVTDRPSVDDERVSSHEVGHILGLHHDLGDAGRLMFSGTNGTELTAEQISAARYAAAGILDGVR